MSNQQKIRLINCFHQPSEIFSLYDYTKIVYPIDGYICMKQISLPDSQPSFIKLEHEYEKIHSILTYPNLIVTLEENGFGSYSLGFYDSIHFHTNLDSCLAKQIIINKSLRQPISPGHSQIMGLQQKTLSFKIKFSSDNIFVLFSLRHPQKDHQKDASKNHSKETITLNQYIEANDNELIVVNVKSKRVVSQSFFTGNVKEMFVKSNDNFSILLEDSTLGEYQLYENVEAKQTSQIYKLSKRQEISHIHQGSKNKNLILSHMWLKQQLIVVNSTTKQIQIFNEGKKTQQISLNDQIKNFKILCPLMFGFIVTNENFVYVYKKIQFSYVCIAEFFIREVGFAPQILMSPQEDVLIYYMDSKKAIQYFCSFNDQVQMQHGTKIKQAKQLKVTGSIGFKKDTDLKVDVNKHNSTFALSHSSTIQLYSVLNFDLYLQESIQSQDISNSPLSKGKLKRMNTMGSVGSISSLLGDISRQQTILRVAIHPFCQILAVALKTKVRIYQILYNELSHVKDLFVSNCSEMFYSNSGQFLCVVVSGKNGSKCYVFRANQEYEMMQTLSIGKKIQKFLWNKYDNYLYGVHNCGYYRWSVENSFKQRFETLFDIPFTVVDAILNDSKDIVILYGQYQILEVNEKMDKQNKFNPKDIINVKKKINQIVYQSGSYFLNILSSDEHDKVVSWIIKCEDLQKTQFTIKQCESFKTSGMFTSSKPPTFYRQANQYHEYQMIVSSGDTKKNIIFLVDEESKNIKVLEWGKSSGQENKASKHADLIKIDRKHLIRLFKKYGQYESQIRKLEQNMHKTIEQMKAELDKKEQQRQKSFLAQLKASQQKYEQVKLQKQKLEHTIEQKIGKHEEQTIKQVKQLQKIYERKIAITTNKLLTSEQINYRNMLLAEENLKKLQKSANNDVQRIREEYKKQLAEYMNEKDYMAEEVYRIKKDYETRLYDLEQENEKMLEQYQIRSEDTIQALRRNLTNEQIKFSEAQSKKDNLQKQRQELRVNNQILKEKIIFLESKNRQANKKTEYLLYDIEKYQKILQEKNTSISIYEERINDLQKSNQILKYRVIELKGQTEPQSQQNEKLKQNLNQLEEEYDKIVKSAFQKEQLLTVVKKQAEKGKEVIQKLESRSKKLQKSYLELIDKIQTITKSPIQQIRKHLINLLNTIRQDDKSLNRPLSSSMGRNQSPLGQLNRIRQHLEICLHEAVDSNKKGQQQKKVQLMKKNRQNSELIKEINDLRKKVRDFENIINEKDILINRMKRGDPIAMTEFKSHSSKKEVKKQHDENQGEDYVSINYSSNQQKIISRSQTRKQTRQTKQSFFDKSLFKSSSHWREKRLKTEHSQQGRNTYSRSVKRNPSGKYLQIEPSNRDGQIDDLKRIIEQKETIIKQLINKVQSLT